MTNVAHPSVLPVLVQLLQESSSVQVDEAEVGISFSELGLDSLFLTQFSVSVSNRFGVTLTFRRLSTELNSLEKLAAFLDETRLRDPSRTPSETEAAVVGQGSTALQPLLSSLAAGPAGGLPLEATEHVVQLFLQQLDVIQQQLLMLARMVAPDAVDDPHRSEAPAQAASPDAAPATAHYASSGAILDATRQPVPGARLGRDRAGRAAWFVPKPDSPGQYEKLERHDLT